MAFTKKAATWSSTPKIAPPEEFILLLGQGRLSRHLQFYFSESLKIPTLAFSWRDCLAGAVTLPRQQAKVCFLLGRDSQLKDQAAWIRHQKVSAPLVHCSGREVVAGVSAWHPLGSFSGQLFALEMYKDISFIGDEKSRPLKELLPQLANASAIVPRTQRELYHALCVFSSNLTSILWAQTQARAQTELPLDPQHFKFLMNSSILNVQREGVNGITGPLTRSDDESARRNLEALGTASQEAVIYREIAKLYRELAKLQLAKIPNNKESPHVDKRV